MLNLKVPELLRQAALVGGAWRAGEPTIPVINPANGAVIAETPDLGADAACEAIDAASGAFAAWSRRPAKERATILRRWSELMLAHGIAVIISQSNDPVFTFKWPLKLYFQLCVTCFISNNSTALGNFYLIIFYTTVFNNDTTIFC